MDKQKIIDNYYDLYQNALHWIKSMLLYDKIRLKEIPQEIRFSNNIIYITALRRKYCVRYSEAINLSQ